jgi:hypothetical protein
VPDGDQRLTGGEVLNDSWLRAHLKSCVLRRSGGKSAPVKRAPRQKRSKPSPLNGILEDVAKIVTNRTATAVKEMLDESSDAAARKRR